MVRLIKQIIIRFFLVKLGNIIQTSQLDTYLRCALIAKLLMHIKNGTVLERIKIAFIPLIIFFYRGTYNKIRYGSNAPFFRQTIYINPSLVTELVVIPHSRLMSGTIVKSNLIFDYKTKLHDHYKFRYMLDRYVNLNDSNQLNIEEGRSWDEIDRLFNSIRQNGVKEELMKHGDGIIIHFDKNGVPLFGGGGFHRLSIAKILNIPIIPAEIGLVHYEALKIVDLSNKIN